MIARIAPMLATASAAIPVDEAAWTFEHKWDGVRLVALWDGASLRFETRNLRDVTAAWPELAGLAGQLEAMGAGPTVLDGEVVAFDDDGRPSFQLLQERMHVADARVAAMKAESVPASYLAFDLLCCGGEDLMGRPWEERRARLDGAGIAGSSWAVTPTFRGEGAMLLEAARAQGLEGVVCKRLGSIYRPGTRSRDWLKVKVLSSDEFVVGGWSPGAGRRSGTIGSLLLGTPLEGGGLAYVGNVGTGFTDAELRRLGGALGPLVTTTSPFTAGPAPKRGAVFVEPQLVVDVAFAERTRDGVLRHPAYRGLRVDKGPDDVETGGRG